ncbi:hypothetical protein N1031_10530 [Herbiconiux moechotypicola]|uniref:Uncharacterized protein n=1 Tax=Herbiconiux moechotypicola TaxID=637393 RepID=A0ABN3DLY4_9MICO|nr:DUF6609 family protein [Herbiconiux moechotypicola]MCS5730198.1 hypothetical protein [Herbiconiux moechotypicola]
MAWLTDLHVLFPLMRGGGAFLVLIGLGIVVGAFGGRRWRTVCLIVGAGLGVAAMAVGGATKLIFAGLPYPPVWQWVVLGIAFAVEFWLVSVVVRRYPDVESRQFWMGILFIVGAHFLLLTPSHGPVCGVLAVACMVNAVIGFRSRADLRVFWGVDGALKVAAGSGMIVLSYA